MLLGVDVGGTFTDAVLIGAGGALHTAKVPSTPAQEALGVLAAVRLVLERAGAEPSQIERFAHGMTVATNALLEGRTARTALLATAGFTDVIELARQNRPHLYDLCRAAPPPLVGEDLRFAVQERNGPTGTLAVLDPRAARAIVEQLALSRPQAVAIALLHSYRDGAHERMLGELVVELLGDVSVSLSSELVGTFREYERTATTALDAALSPSLAAYLGELARESRGLGLREPLVMQSSGGLTEIEQAGAHAALTVLSGPAGGVAGAQLLAGLAGERQVLCFDMGGTSCDVCLIEDGRVGETAEREVAGRPLALPALDIHTVGAGGGSIAWRDSGGALRVGPQSAGASPGPACYGRGAEQPTVTDANLLLGRLLDDTPLAGEIVLDRAAAERAIAALARELGLETLACAEGIVRVAEAEMLGALRVMSIERGIDPRGFALMPFGGAGGLHAASLAAQLGIEHVLCPRASGVLCALGLAAAAPRRDAARTVMLHGAELSPERLESARSELLERAAAALGTPPARTRLRYELRYAGQSFELPVERHADDADLAPADPAELRESFARAHERRYGYRDDDAEVELVNVRVSVWGRAPGLEVARVGATAAAGETRDVLFAGGLRQARVVRGGPAPGETFTGPAVCALEDATVLIPPAWSAHADEHGTLHLLAAQGAP